MSNIKRLNVEKRYSDAAIYNGVVYLAGQIPETPSKDIVGQTAEVLETIDRLLAEAGSDKHHILMAQVFIADLADVAGMNQAWDAWVSQTSAPPRATVEARLVNAQWKVEIVVTAALA